MSYSFSFVANKVSVVIPRRFSLFLLIFLPFWAAAWITMALKATHVTQPESIAALALFSLVTVLMTYVWLWNIGGREELEFTASALTYRRTLFGIARTRVFRMNLIQNPHFENSRARGKSRVPSGIGFSYAGKQVKFGDHLTQRDANEIVANVLQQLPELTQYWGNYAEGLPELNEDLSLSLR
jgi:hypothetical protein